ncbi:transcriptional regulator [Streptomyces sp. NPDC000594]|uniref:AfsR/SARP family transcriptional regulator n=1 Tax=Streptomyces sp. NPDC000594 TaxID=3154261 RepID=UPI0033246720
MTADHHTMLRFAVLGPVRGALGGEPLRLGPPQQRAVLAQLLLSRGGAVSLPELLEGLWGQRVPARAVGVLRTYVFRLRGLIEPGRPARVPAAVLVNAGDGYALRLPPQARDGIDAERLERLTASAAGLRAAGDLRAAHGELTRALALWGGTPLAGLPGPHAHRQRDRLTELWLAAREDHFETALGLGLHTTIVGPLRAFAAEHPLRERTQALLMLALHRAGRQADAFTVYETARRTLRDELGVAPGLELRTLRTRLLDTPDLPPPPSGGPAAPASAGARVPDGPADRGPAALDGPVATTGHSGSYPTAALPGPGPGVADAPGSGAPSAGGTGVPEPAGAAGRGVAYAVASGSPGGGGSGRLPVPGSGDLYSPGTGVPQPAGAEAVRPGPAGAATGHGLPYAIAPGPAGIVPGGGSHGEMPEPPGTGEAPGCCCVGHGTGRAPAQLDAAVGDFRDRAREEARLRLRLRAAAAGRTMAVAVLTGPPGIGKTALALQAAHAVRDLFPGGQLHADLAGADLDLVLARLLRTLGVPGHALPHGTAPRAALYRSLLAGRRVLIVLDNARSTAQLRPLLPGSPGCAVLVTSGSRAIAVPGALRLDLAPLTEAGATALLGAVAGRRRVAAEPGAVRELLRACDRFPLAVRIAADRLAARPHWKVADLAARLRDEDHRLDELRIDGTGVADAFRPAQEGLDPALTRAFALLSVIDLPAFGRGTAAALLGVAEDEAGHLLESLVDRALLETPGADRYRSHDLVRLVARRELARRPDGRRERDAALRRLIAPARRRARSARGPERHGQMYPSRSA